MPQRQGEGQEVDRAWTKVKKVERTKKRNGGKTVLALKKTPIIRHILFILLFLFLAILNYILDFDLHLSDFRLFNDDIARALSKYLFMLLCPYTLSLNIVSFQKGLLFCQDLAKLSPVNLSLQTHLTFKCTHLLHPPCSRNIWIQYITCHVVVQIVYTSALQ